MIFVVVDGHTRWGGSQYINSAAQGNYADYVCDEVTRAVESQHAVPKKGIRRIIAGHSSGGFGAIRLGMIRPKLYDSIVALSPDSDFQLSHLPRVQSAAVAKVPLEEIERVARGESPLPDDGNLTYALALSAAYAPRSFFHRGQFQWIYDARGVFRAEVWQCWMENDPLTILQKQGVRAFGVHQSIYLDGAAQDELTANIGARKMFDLLVKNGARCAFYEPPGHHSDHLQDRLQRGVAWAFGQPVKDIP